MPSKRDLVELLRWNAELMLVWHIEGETRFVNMMPALLPAQLAPTKLNTITIIFCLMYRAAKVKQAGCFPSNVKLLGLYGCGPKTSVVAKYSYVIHHKLKTDELQTSCAFVACM